MSTSYEELRKELMTKPYPRLLKVRENMKLYNLRWHPSSNHIMNVEIVLHIRIHVDCVKAKDVGMIIVE